MTFDPAAIAAFKADALARWPEEACGLITAVGYAACANVAADPTIDFRIAEDVFAGAGEVLAVMHSHTHRRLADGSLEARPVDAPSLADQVAQPASAVPWGISCVTRSDGGEMHATEPFFFGDEAPIPPLVGRAFRWGVTDCWALVRDWYRLRGVVLVNLPREAGWEHHSDLLVGQFTAAGFAPIEEGEVRLGDVCLMRVNFHQANHCGVMVENGLLLHHLYGCLSGHRPASRSRSQITHWLRHESMA